jgi:3-methyladenine DNA glycosylase AlkD
MTRRWIADHRTLSPAEVLAVADSLTRGESHEEKTLAALLIRAHALARRAVRPADLERWLGRLNGWAEIDSFCQNAFTAGEMLAAWAVWRTLIEGLSRDGDINKRRASLVLLTGPVHYCDDPRFRDLALATIDTPKAERPILITKAVSWLLRSMATRHPATVARYLADNRSSLPAIAVRETTIKLATGTKSGRTRIGQGKA